MTTPLTPAGLRCAHKVDPLGVAPDRVRFSWVLQGTGSGRAQTAYQVLVALGEPDGPLVWDSGRVASSASADITYAGQRLAGGTRYRWKVQAWDEAGLASGCERPGRLRDRIGPNGWLARLLDRPRPA